MLSAFELAIAGISLAVMFIVPLAIFVELLAWPIRHILKRVYQHRPSARSRGRRIAWLGFLASLSLTGALFFVMPLFPLSGIALLLPARAIHDPRHEWIPPAITAPAIVCGGVWFIWANDYNPILAETLTVCLLGLTTSLFHVIALLHPSRLPEPSPNPMASDSTSRFPN